jgi:mRNA interferase MazF
MGEKMADTEESKDGKVLSRIIQRGEIYWIAPEGPHGSIPPIKHPHLVVQDDLFNASRISTVVVCGITSNLKRANDPGTVLLEVGEGGLQRQSVVLASQISSVPKTQLGECIGKLSTLRVEQALSGLRFLQHAFVAGRESGTAW